MKDKHIATLYEFFRSSLKQLEDRQKETQQELYNTKLALRDARKRIEAVRAQHASQSPGAAETQLPYLNLISSRGSAELVQVPATGGRGRGMVLQTIPRRPPAAHARASQARILDKY